MPSTPINNGADALKALSNIPKIDTQSNGNSSVFTEVPKTQGNSKYDKNIPLPLALDSKQLQDYRHYTQGALDVIGNGLGQLVFNTGNDILQTIGYLGGGINGLIHWDYNKVINNDLVNYSTNIQTQIDKDYPEYLSTQQEYYKEHNFSKYLGSRGFWFNDLLGQGVPFLASAWLTGYGTGALTEGMLGTLAKTGKIGDYILGLTKGTIKPTNAIQRILATQLQNLPKTAAAAMSTYIEGGFEAQQTYQQIITNLKDARGKGENGYSDQQIQDLATKGAEKDHLFNMALIPLSEYQFAGVFKSPNQSRKLLEGLFANIGEKGVLGALESGMYYGKEALANGLKEGTQEGLQQAIQDTFQNNPNENTWNAVRTTLGNFAKNWNSPNYLDQEVSGFLLGAPFGIHEHFSNKQEQNNNLAAIRKQVGANLLDLMKDPSTQKVDQKLYDLIKNTSWFSDLERNKNVASLIGNNKLYNYFQNMQFAQMAKQFFDLGLGDKFEKLIDLQGSKSKEELLSSGLFSLKQDNNRELTSQEITHQLQEKRKTYENLYNTVEVGFNNAPKVIRDYAYKLAVMQNMNNTHLSELNNEINNILLKNPNINASQSETEAVDKWIEKANKDLQDPKSNKDIVKNNLDYLNKRKQELKNTAPLEHVSLPEELNPVQGEFTDDIKLKSLYSSLVDLNTTRNTTNNLVKELTQAKESTKENPYQNITPVKEEIKKKKEKEELEKQKVKSQPVLGYIQSSTGERVPYIQKHVLADGSTDYTHQDSDGNIKVLNNKKDSYHEEQKSSKSLDNEKEVLFKNHFLKLYKHGLNRNDTFLQDDGSTITAEELNKLLQKVLLRPDWKEHLKLQVGERFVKENRKLSKDKRRANLDAKNANFPLGQALKTNIDIELAITDPDTGKSYTGFHTFNPLFYSIRKTGDILNAGNLDYEQAKKVFKLINTDELTPEEWSEIQREWTLLNEFDKAAAAYYSAKVSKGDFSPTKFNDLPKDAIDFEAIGKLDYTGDFRKVDKIKGFTGVIVNKNIETRPNIPKDAPILPDSLIQGYWGLFKIPNGNYQWIHLSAEIIQDEKEILDRLSTTISKLAGLKKEQETEAQALIDELNMYIPANNIGVNTHFNVYFDENYKVSNTQEDERWVLRFAIGNQFKTIYPERLKNIKDLLSYLNKNVAEVTFTKKSFRNSIDKENPNTDNLVSNISDNILTDMTIKFIFNTPILEQEIGKPEVKKSQELDEVFGKQETLKEGTKKQDEKIKKEIKFKENQPNISEIKKSNKKETFILYSKEGTSREISGYALTTPEYPDFKGFIFKDEEGYWRMAENVTGKTFTIPDKGSNTIKEILVESKDVLNEISKSTPENLKVARSVGLFNLTEEIETKSSLGDNTPFTIVGNLSEDELVEAQSKDQNDELSIIRDQLLMNYPAEQVEEMLKDKKFRESIAKNTNTKQENDNIDPDLFKIVSSLDEITPSNIQEVQDYLRNILPEEFPSEIVDSIVANIGNGKVPVSRVHDSVIQLTKNTNKAIAGHEAFHIISLYLLSDSEYQKYEDEIKKELNWSKDTITNEKLKLLETIPKYKVLSDSALEKVLFNEKIAEKFEAWKAHKENESFWGKLFDIIQRFIDWISGREDLGSLFRKIDSGAFRNSEVINKGFLSKGIVDYYKVLGAKSAKESQQILYMILAKKVQSNNILSTEQILNNLAEEFNPYSTNNIKLVKESDTPNLLLNYLKDEFGFYNTPQVRDVIKNEISKLLEILNIQEEDYIESYTQDNDRELSQKLNDKSDYEYAPEERLLTQVKLFLYSTTYKDNKFGKDIELGIDPIDTYIRLLNVVHSKTKSEFMDSITTLGKYNPQVQGVVNKIKTETQYDEDTKNPTKNKELFNRIWQAFNLAAVPFFTSEYDTSTNTTRIVPLNQYKAGDIVYEKWENDYYKNLIKLNSKSYKDSVVLFLDKAIQSKSPELIKQALDKLGLDFNIDYLKYSFESASIEKIQQVSIEDLKAIRNIVQGYNPENRTSGDIFEKFTSFEAGKGAMNKMKAFAFGQTLLNGSYFQPLFFSSDGSPRYSFIPRNLILDRTQEFKKRYTNNDNITKDQTDEYRKYNKLVKHNKVKEIWKEIISGIGGDIRTKNVTKKGEEYFTNDEIFKDFNARDFLKLIIGGFTSPEIINGIRYAYFQTGLNAEKSTNYITKLPIEAYITKKGVLSDALKSDLWDLFLQEYRRVRGDYQNIPSKEWLNMPWFRKEFISNNTELKDILNSNDIGAHKDKLLSIILNHLDGEFRCITDTFKEYKIKIPKNAIELYGSEENFFKNYMYNDYILSTAYNQLIKGDIGNSVEKKNYALTVADHFKREGSNAAAGQTSGDRDYNIVYIKDEPKYMKLGTLNSISQEVYNKLSPEDQKLHKAYDPQDSSTFSSVRSLIDLLQELGRINTNKVDPKISTQLELLQQILNPKIDSKGNIIPINSLDIINNALDLIPKKYVFAGFNSNGVKTYGKTAIAFLTKELTSIYDKKTNSWVARRGFELLHNKRELLENSNVDFIMMNSAAKQGSENAISIQELREGKAHITPTKINGNYIRLQQENNSKFKDHIPLGTQIIQLIDYLSKPENKEFSDTLKANIISTKLQELELAKSVMLDGDSRKKDLTEFVTKLQSIISSSTPNVQWEELLSIGDDGDFKYDTNLLPISRKLENIIFSHFKDVFKLQIPGRYLTIMSGFGFNIITDSVGTLISQEEYDRDPKRYDDKSYKTRPLRIYQGGDSLVSEIMITKGQLAKLGLKPGEIIPAKALEGIGMRIPTQSHHSMIIFKVARFLPEYYGDIIVLPDEYVYLSGLDMDLDKEFIYQPLLYRDKNKELKLYGDAQEVEDKYYEYRNYLITYNKDIRRKLSKLVKNDTESRELLDYVKRSKQQLADDNEFMPDLKYALREDRKNIDISKDNFLELKLGRLTDETLKYFNLPSNIQEYINASQPESLGSQKNKIIDSLMKIARLPELQKSFTSPLTGKKFQDAKDEIEKLLDSERPSLREPNIINSFSGKFKAFNNNRGDSVGLRGIAVQGNNQIAWLTKNQVSTNTEFKIDNDTFSTFDTNTDLSNQKSADISGLVGEIIDAVKNAFPNYFNLDRWNTSAFETLMGLGIGSKDSSDLTILYMMKQPMVSELKKEMTISSAETITAQQRESIDSIINTIEKLQTKFNTEIKANLEPEEYTEIMQEFHNRFETLKKSNLEDSLKAIGTDFNEIKNLDIKESLVTNKSKTINQYLGLATQMNLLGALLKAKNISNDSRNIGKLMNLNTFALSSFDDIESHYQAVLALGLGELIGQESTTELEYLNAKDKVLNDPLMLANIQALQDMEKSISKFFIKSTPRFREIRGQIRDSLAKTKRGSATNIFYQGFMAFLHTRALAWSLKKDNLESLNFLIYPEMAKSEKKETLADTFERLLQYPSFRDSFFVMAHKALKAYTPENDSDINKIVHKFQSNLTKDTRERFMFDTIAMDNPKVGDADAEIIKKAQIPQKLFIEAGIKNNFLYNNKDNKIDFISPVYFARIANYLAQMNNILANNTNVDKEFKDSFNNEFSSLVQEYKELFFSNSINRDFVKRIWKGKRSPEYNTILVKDKLTKVQVYDFKLSTDDLSIRPLVEKEEHLKGNYTFAFKVDSKGDISEIKYPEYIRMTKSWLDKGVVYKLVSNSKISAEYKALKMYDIGEQSPYGNSIDYDRKLSDALSGIIRKDETKSKNISNIKDSNKTVIKKGELWKKYGAQIIQKDPTMSQELFESLDPDIQDYLIACL